MTLSREQVIEIAYGTFAAIETGDNCFEFNERDLVAFANHIYQLGIEAGREQAAVIAEKQDGVHDHIYAKSIREGKL